MNFLKNLEHSRAHCLEKFFDTNARMTLVLSDIDAVGTNKNIASLTDDLAALLVYAAQW